MSIITIIPIYADEELAFVASGELGEGKAFIETDGNYYADPSCVELNRLSKTDRTYNCPYKGMCYYWDLIDENGEVLVTDFAWVYETPKAGWEHIDGKFGFYTYDNQNYLVKVGE